MSMLFAQHGFSMYICVCTSAAALTSTRLTHPGCPRLGRAGREGTRPPGGRARPTRHVLP